MNFIQMLTDKATESITDTWQTKVMNAVDNILVPILVIACSVGMVWAIVVGIKMMKADDKSKRDEAKATLVNIAISIVAIAVLIGLFYALMHWLDDSSVEGETFGDLFEEGTGMIGNTLSLVKQCASMIIFKC